MNLSVESFQKNSKYLKNDYAQMWMNEDIVFIQYFEGVISDLRCAEKILEDRLRISERVPQYVHGDCRGVKYWTAEARKFQSTKENAAHVLAGTVVTSNNHVLNTIMNFYLKFNKLHFPAKFCHSNLAALKWLYNFRGKG